MLHAVLAASAFFFFGRGFLSSSHSPSPFVPILGLAVLALGEELFFRGFARKVTGDIPSIVLAAFLMPFFFANSFTSYVGFLVLFAALALVSTWLARTHGILSSMIFRELILLIAFGALYAQQLPIALLVFLLALWAGSLPGGDWRKWFGNAGVKAKVKEIPMELVWGVGLALIAEAVLLVEVSLLARMGISDVGKVATVLASQSLLSLGLIMAFQPIGEEMLFRGVLQKRIGVVFSSAVFAGLHAGFGSIVEIVGAFSVSLLFGAFVRSRKNKGILPTIVAHIILNTAAVLSVMR